MEWYDPKRHTDYQCLAEVWYSKFRIPITKGRITLKFVDPNGEVFDLSLLNRWSLTRHQLNRTIESYMDDENMIQGIRGILYEVDQLDYALDRIKERFFYEMVEEEEKLERKSV